MEGGGGEGRGEVGRGEKWGRRGGKGWIEMGIKELVVTALFILFYTDIYIFFSA